MSYTIVFEDETTMIVDEIVINKIPFLKNKNSKTIILDSVARETFGVVLSMIKCANQDYCINLVTKMNVDKLMDFIVLTNLLELEQYKLFACRFFKKVIDGNTIDGIRNAFSIKNDFSPHEQEFINKNYNWLEIIN